MSARDLITTQSARDALGAVGFRNAPPPTRPTGHIRLGLLSAVALGKLLEPATDPLVKVRFRPALTGSPNTVLWQAATESAETVTGTLVVHAEVGDDEVRTWVSVWMDQRIDPMARRVALEYIRRRHGLERADGEQTSDEHGEHEAPGEADPP